MIRNHLCLFWCDNSSLLFTELMKICSGMAQLVERWVTEWTFSGPITIDKPTLKVFISRWNMIVLMIVILSRTVFESDWHCDNLCGSHRQRQSELHHVDILHSPWWSYSSYLWNDSCVQTIHCFTEGLTKHLENNYWLCSASDFAFKWLGWPRRKKWNGSCNSIRGRKTVSVIPTLCVRYQLVQKLVFN